MATHLLIHKIRSTNLWVCPSGFAATREVFQISTAKRDWRQSAVGWW